MSLTTTLRFGLTTQRLLGRLRTLGLVISPYYLFRERVPDDPPPAPGAGFRSELLRRDELDSAAACTTWGSVREFAGRLDRGHVCVALKHRTADGRESIAGYTWADLNEINDAACRAPLAEDEAYLYDAFVAEAHRGRALAPHLRYCCYQVLRSQGREHFYSVSDYFNTPAIRFKLKLGAEVARVGLQVELFGRGPWHWILRRYPPRGAGAGAVLDEPAITTLAATATPADRRRAG